jgi:methionyl-tRNA synthetase
MQTHRYLEELWRVLSIANKAIEQHAPWVKMKDESSVDQALATVALVANLLARAAVALHPVMPKITQTIARALGFEINNESYRSLILNKEMLKTFTIEKTGPLFPRIEEPLLPEAPEALTASKQQQEEKTATPDKKESTVDESMGLITIDQFFETKLQVGTIVAVEEVPKSKKLFKLQVDLGEDAPRQIVAGIRQFYEADELLNTQACVVANLKPAKLMGLLSEGMLLAAKDDDGLCLVRPEKPRQVGAGIG